MNESNKTKTAYNLKKTNTNKKKGFIANRYCSGRRAWDLHLVWKQYGRANCAKKIIAAVPQLLTRRRGARPEGSINPRGEDYKEDSVASTVGGYTQQHVQYLGAGGYRAPPAVALHIFARLICLSISIHRLPQPQVPTSYLPHRRATQCSGCPPSPHRRATQYYFPFPPRPRAPTNLSPPVAKPKLSELLSDENPSTREANRSPVAFDQQPIRCCAAVCSTACSAPAGVPCCLPPACREPPCRPPSFRSRCERFFFFPPGCCLYFHWLLLAYLHVRGMQVRRQRVRRAAMGERAGGGARQPEEATADFVPALHLRCSQQQPGSSEAARQRSHGAVQDGRCLRRRWLGHIIRPRLLFRPRRHP